MYRYDPPVLVIGATWHEKKQTYVESLLQALRQAYFGHEDYVWFQCGRV